MNILFVHQNFPGQYLHLVRALAKQPGNRVVFITQRADGQIPGVTKIVYKPPRRKDDARPHPYLRDLESSLANAVAVWRIARDLKQKGFVPDVMLGHNGWGEIWNLKDVYPDVPLVGYFEFFYQAVGADVGFDTAVPSRPDDGPRLRLKNTGNLLGLAAADRGQSPTLWQQSTYPALYRPRITVVHDGIDTDKVTPDANARLDLPAHGLSLAAGDEVLTYVARNLEHYRGFHIFMHALPRILDARPQATVLIVGGDEVSYGPRMPEGQSLRAKLLAELGDAIDLSRVHFLGKVPYTTFLNVLQVSRAHVYLTYPFVLSWSMMEAMAAGCLLIGSKTPPVEEILRDGENGLMVDFFDAGAIADAAIASLSAPEDFAHLCKAARQTIAENYDLIRHCLPRQQALIADLV